MRDRYFDYFGARAGDRRKGYCSFDLETWHLIALNSGGDDACNPVSCDAGSDQEGWLHNEDNAKRSTRPEPSRTDYPLRTPSLTSCNVSL
jgi:hypothetical protein